MPALYARAGANEVPKFDECIGFGESIRHANVDAEYFRNFRHTSFAATRNLSLLGDIKYLRSRGRLRTIGVK